MSKLNIVVEYDDLSVDATLDNQSATLQIQDILFSRVSDQISTDQISTDPYNALSVGSDNKFLVSNADQLLTNYNFSSVIDAEWNT